MKKITRGLISSAFLLSLAACGGGSSGGGSSGGTPGGGTPPTTTATITRTGLSGCTATQLEGTAEDKGLAVAGVSLLQVVEQNPDDSRTVLAGGKDVLVRLDVTAPKIGVSLPKAKLIIGHDGESGCKEISFTATSTTAPTAVDRRTLATSLTATIPAADVREGLSYQILVDAETPSTKTAANRLYKSGDLDVSPALSEETFIIPIAFQGSTGSVPSTDALKTLISRALPLASVSVSMAPAQTLASLKVGDATLVGGVYYFPKSKMDDVLNELNSDCLGRAPVGTPAHEAPHCVAVWPLNVAFGSPSDQTAGRALIGGSSMMVGSFSLVDDAGIAGPYLSQHWLTVGALNFLHEYGHLMNLGHAACGVSDNLDADLFADGRLGDLAGYDAVRKFYFLGTAANGFADIMSYCGKGWSSDKGYRKVIDYKLNGSLVVDVPTA